MAKLHSVPLHRNANFERPPELTETDFTGDPEFEGADKSILAMETISDSSAEERVSIFIVFVFILELLVLVFVCVLEYFLRLTDVFPVRMLKFSCQDEDIQYTKAEGELTFDDFAYNADVSEEIIISLCFCVPPVIILIAEIALWAFTDERQKTVHAMCKQCKVPQVVRRILRFIGCFLFGLVLTMVFTDVTKLFTGRLRPRFLEICKHNATVCVGDELYTEEEVCTETDDDKLRDARLSFPSLHASMTAFAAVYMAVYMHHVLRTPTVKVMRPFLSLSFLALTLMCGLARYGLHHSHWTDVAAGWALGLIVALYLGVFALNDFRERLSSHKLYSKLTHFLHEQRSLELRDLYKENWENLERHGYNIAYPPSHMDTYYNTALVIPRPHLQQPSNESHTDVEYVMREVPPADHHRRTTGGTTAATQQRQNHNTFQRDLQRTLDHYRGADNLGYSHM